MPRLWWVFGNPGIVELRLDNFRVQGLVLLCWSDRGYLTAYRTCTTRSRHHNPFRALSKDIPLPMEFQECWKTFLLDPSIEGEVNVPFRQVGNTLLRSEFNLLFCHQALLTNRPFWCPSGGLGIDCPDGQLEGWQKLFEEVCDGLVQFNVFIIWYQNLLDLL